MTRNVKIKLDLRISYVGNMVQSGRKLRSKPDEGGPEKLYLIITGMLLNTFVHESKNRDTHINRAGEKHSFYPPRFESWVLENKLTTGR